MYAEMLFIDFRAAFSLSSYSRLDLKQDNNAKDLLR